MTGESAMKKRNVYHDILFWGEERMASGVSFQELEGFLKQQHLGVLSEKRMESVFRELFVPIDGKNVDGAIETAIKNGEKFHLKVEAAFRLLEIQELEEARDSSKTALKVAISAIVIGAFVGLGQICVALFG